MFHRLHMIPGILINIITFPGIIVHEFAHLIFCKLTGTEVLQVCYFRFGNPAGFVVHGPPKSAWRHILVGVGPLFVNTGLGLACGLVAFHAGYDLDQPRTAASAILLWLSVSIAMHAFPSRIDAKSIWDAIRAEGTPIAPRLLGTPIVAIIWVGALASIFWLDVVYGAAVVIGGPKLTARIPGLFVWNYPVKIGDTREHVHEILGMGDDNYPGADDYSQPGLLVNISYEDNRVTHFLIFADRNFGGHPHRTRPVLYGIAPTMTRSEVIGLIGQPDATPTGDRGEYSLWIRPPYKIMIGFLDPTVANPDPGMKQMEVERGMDL